MKNYHVYVNIALDTLHDIAEGACIFTLEGLLDHYSKTGILGLPLINQRIKDFKFSSIGEKNPPPPLKSSNI